MYKVFLCNTDSLGTRCGYGEGKTRQAAVEAALRLARQRDPAAYYNENTGTVDFSGSYSL